MGKKQYIHSTKVFINEQTLFVDKCLFCSKLFLVYHLLMHFYSMPISYKDAKWIPEDTGTMRLGQETSIFRTRTQTITLYESTASCWQHCTAAASLHVMNLALL